MKKTFNEKYIYYCRSREIRDEIFRMTQGPNESLEYFEEIFQLRYKIAHNCTLDEDSLELVLLKGVREDLMETLNLLSNGNIYQMYYGDIKQTFKNHSRSSRKKGRNSREMVPESSKPYNPRKNESGGLIEDMKIDILHYLSMQMDTLQIKKKPEEAKIHYQFISLNALRGILKMSALYTSWMFVVFVKKIIQLTNFLLF
jgi:hypothetical protein